MQEMNTGSPKKKFRKQAIAAIVCLLAGGWIYYFCWAAGISARTILMPELPEFTTCLIFGALVGIVFAGRAIRAGETAKGAIQSFGGGFCISLFFSINFYDVCAYLLPGKVVSYESEYEVTYPGPSRYCEAGLWINDPNTHRRIELCTNKTELNERIGRGIYAVWVTARTNKLGSYIIGYTFFRK
ncbi:hypothetical protein [Pseudomonas fluorescens]|uniref:Transmembrane protein n=1 Tax=Pseudomonas fluorescens TaxID=294 RepID=A0A5E6PWJ6_PSEFL|nr:hypothetical protein [Pseudomonas fluorescens]VVM48096.1 hypothetical protein PS655_00629 [Pseudomonas fluorescens]